MMQTDAVRTIRLDNGLDLGIYDESRRIAPGRWLVRMVARIVVPIDSIAFPQGQNVSEIVDLLGDAVVFEQIKERNFIDEKEKDAAFAAVCETFLKSTRAYLSHPDFARKLVFKQYRDRKAHRSRG